MKFSTDYPSMTKLSAADNCKEAPSRREEKLIAAYKKLIPPDAPPPDAHRQALLNSDVFFVSERELANRLEVSVSLLKKWRGGGSGPPFYKLGAGRTSVIRYWWPEILLWLRAFCWIKPASPRVTHVTEYRAGRVCKWEFSDL